ncbi:flagellar biosynthetic protein FliQ [Aminivibrio pyruvatiphilus]|uniref:Flagellar biosynthetic protein FliQ n=1 Tax=Aminivibrio pyruvatiphilus TaxID=1005740 RepID=A0A4R8MM25_9BACT|nr:flagellar biosynthetic protein FliQ [Aminivibrio pyruvatiphilus]
MFSVNMYDVLSNAIWTTLVTSLPVLLVAMLVGLVIGILQTATSIQEQTLIFIPKIVAVLLALVVFGPWMFGRVGDMARLIFGQLERFVR